MIDKLIAASKFANEFWSKVDRTAGNEECWPWTGRLSTTGYGQFAKGSKGGVRSHRLAFFLVTGKHPDELHVCHVCDNPICCNPQHLWLGTAKDNIQDSIKKGKHINPKPLKGEKNPSAKLSERDILDIKKLCLNVKNKSLIASSFGISRTHLYRILNGERWTHL